MCVIYLCFLHLRMNVWVQASRREPSAHGRRASLWWVCLVVLFGCRQLKSNSLGAAVLRSPTEQHQRLLDCSQETGTRTICVLCDTCEIKITETDKKNIYSLRVFWFTTLKTTRQVYQIYRVPQASRQRPSTTSRIQGCNLQCNVSQFYKEHRPIHSLDTHYHACLIVGGKVPDQTTVALPLRQLLQVLEQLLLYPLSIIWQKCLDRVIKTAKVKIASR